VDTSTPGQAGTPCADGTILTTAQLATSALHEGQAVHAIVSPFGCVTAYKVAVGDTLFDIAHSFSVSGAYLTLYQWNASVVGKDPALIHPGQVIIVDPTGKVTAPQ
jgi:nucleoid-associated protein YgaU